jgi:hypothetical protein
MTTHSSVERLSFDLTVPVEERAEVADWFDENASPIAARLNRYLIMSRGKVSFLPSEHTLAVAFRLRWESDDVEPPAPPPISLPTFGGTKPRLTIYSRNAVSWVAARSWCKATKKADMAALKTAKALCAGNIVAQAADELSEVLSRFIGCAGGSVCVTTVPCGHSKRPDCLAAQVAGEVADRMGFVFRKVFEDRFVDGVSHPKEFSKLPPLQIVALPAEALVLLIDDVATSGWHMEESLSSLRGRGLSAFGAVWISGTLL